MNVGRCCPGSPERLVRFVDEFFAQVPPPPDYRTIPRIAIALCNAVDTRLSMLQRRAVDTAKAYLMGDAEEHSTCLEDLGQHMEATSRDQSISATEKALDRLAWGALVTNTKLSGYACEFLVGLGEDVGVPLDTMADIVVREIPGMSEWCNGCSKPSRNLSIR